MKRTAMAFTVLSCIVFLLFGCDGENEKPQDDIRTVEVKVEFPAELKGTYDGTDGTGDSGTVIISENDFSVMGVSMVNLLNSTIKSNEAYAKENGLSYAVSYEATSPDYGEYSLSVRHDVEGLIHFALYYFKLNDDGTVTMRTNVITYDGSTTDEKNVLKKR